MKITKARLRQIIKEEVSVSCSNMNESMGRRNGKFNFNTLVLLSLNSTISVKKVAGDEWMITIKNARVGEFWSPTIRLIAPVSYLEDAIPDTSEVGDRSYKFLQSVGFPFDEYPTPEEWYEDNPRGLWHSMIVKNYLEEYVEQFHNDKVFLLRLRRRMTAHSYIFRDITKGIQLTIKRIQSYLNSKRMQNIIKNDSKFLKKLKEFFSISAINIVQSIPFGDGLSAAGTYNRARSEINIDLSSSRRSVPETVYHEFLHHWQKIFDEPASFDWTFSALQPEEAAVPDEDADAEYQELYANLLGYSNDPLGNFKRLAAVEKKIMLPDQLDRNTVRQAMQKEKTFFSEHPDVADNRNFTFKAFYQFQKNHFTMSLRRLFMVLNNMGYDLDTSDQSSVTRFKKGLSDFIDLKFPAQIYVQNGDLFAIPLFLKNTAKNRNLIVRLGSTLASNSSTAEPDITTA